MRSLLIQLILVLSPVLALAALPPPEFRCVELNETDDITLHWTSPADPGNEFITFIVYYQASSIDPFIVLNTVPLLSQESLFETGLFAGNGKFYMVTVFDDGSGVDTSISSDTVAPMLISAVANGTSIQLSWNDLQLPSEDSIYRISRRTVGEDWVIIDSTDYFTTSLLDSAGACTETYEYMVEIGGLGGCLSRSNRSSVTITDDVAPEINDLLCASVDTATGAVKLEWRNSVSPDVFGYLVYYFSDFNWIDTTFDTIDLTFTFDKRGINAQVQPETLSVAGFDSCFSNVTMFYNVAPGSDRFSTIFGEVTDIDRCEGEVTFQWNMPDDEYFVGVLNPSEYRIYAKDEQGVSTLRGTVGPEDSVFIDTNVALGQNYTYVIAAYDAETDKEAISNKIEVTLSAPNLPDHLYISCVSGDHETDENVVHIETDTVSDVREYRLLRSLSRDTEFQAIQRIGDPRSSSFSIADESDYGNQGPFFYMVQGLDECGLVITSTDTVRSVRLEGFLDNTDLLVNLEWNAYEGFDSSSTVVDDYELVRLTSDVNRDYLFTSALPGTYQDNLVPLDNVGGNICYYVEINESNENSLGLMETCQSNLLCFPQDPRVFIPNAFTPDGDMINDTFLPYVNYVEPGSYRLNIYDRSGNLVFSTSDPTEGWDGVGSAIGVYVYRMDLVNVRGEEDVFSGKLHLVR